MHARIALAAATVVAACLAGGLPAASAEVVETPPGSVSSAQVSLAIDNDWQFIDGECLLIPILATYGRANDTSIIGELTVTKPTDPGVTNDGTFLVLPGDPVSGQVLDEIFVCPADGTGEYRVSTVIRAIEPSVEQSFELDPLTFWVRPATSRMSDLTVRAVKGSTRITGSVTAGESVASGIVEIRVESRNRQSGKSRLILTDRVPVEDGVFTSDIASVFPAGTRVKATLTGCSWCSRVSASTRVR